MVLSQAAKFLTSKYLSKHVSSLKNALKIYHEIRNLGHEQRKWLKFKASFPPKGLQSQILTSIGIGDQYCNGASRDGAGLPMGMP